MREWPRGVEAVMKKSDLYLQERKEEIEKEEEERKRKRLDCEVSNSHK